MKKLILLLFVAALPAAAITRGQTVTCSQPVQAQFACTAPTSLHLNAGDTVVFWAYNDTKAGFVQDNCGHSNDWQPTTPSTSTSGWYLLNVPAAVDCVITFTRNSGQDARNVWIATVYSGVGSIGQMSKRFGGTGILNCAANPTCGTHITTQDAGNYVAGMVQVNAGTTQGGNLTIASGTQLGGLVQTPNGSIVAADITSPTAGTQVTISGNVSALTNFYGDSSAIELRVPLVTIGGRAANVGDMGHLILLNNTQNMSNFNYTLPNTLLTTSWCDWVMPTNTTGAFQLALQSPSQLNGGTANVSIPPWQMSKVCQDYAGNYWAAPPLVAGTGITITPSPTAITISGGTGNAPQLIAAGSIVLGTAVVPANGSRFIRTIVAGLSNNDTVIGSTGATSVGLTTVPGWSGGALNYFLSIQSDASAILTTITNSSATDVTPQSITVQYKVIR
jgi:hypothetical protein